MAFRSGLSANSISTLWSMGTRARRLLHGAGAIGSQSMVSPAAREGVRIVPLGGGVVAVGQGVQRHVALKSYDAIDIDHLDGDGAVKAPMHGKVLAIFVELGAAVVKGQRVAVVEAMKMEHALLAPVDGTVSEIAVAAGAQVAEGAKVMMIEAAQGEG